MKRKYKCTLIVELLGFIGSYVIYACCTGRLDIWNLPENIFCMFLVPTIVMCLIGGIPNIAVLHTITPGSDS